MALSELVARLMRVARSGQPVATALADRRLDDALEAAAAGNHDRACAISEEMVERFPRHAAGHRLLGMLRARSGEPGAALPHLERAASLAPDWPDAYLALGNVQQLLRNAPAATREKMVTAAFVHVGPDAVVARIMVAPVRRSMLAARVARDRQPAC